MSSRLYDYILQVTDTSPFNNGNNIIGLSSGTLGYIANVDPFTNNVKVKVNNAFQEFTVGESIVSNHLVLSNVISVQNETGDNNTRVFAMSGTTIPRSNAEISLFVNGAFQHRGDNFNRDYYIDSSNRIVFNKWNTPKLNASIIIRRETGNTLSQLYSASYSALANSVSSSSSVISKIHNNPLTKESNSFEQNPLVRLYSVYYPGEWYPPNENGNPSNEGEGYAWPVDIPWNIAEVVADYNSDISYNVSFAGSSYLAYPVESDAISTNSEGSIDDLSIKISNYDNVISAFVENPNLVGNVTSNSAQAYVNGELVYGLDPATITNNTHFDQTVVDTYYGKTNSPWIYTRAVEQAETWKSLKYDSRDLLGAVVEVKSTFANHLKYWPEYSKVDTFNGNVVQIINSAPYRVGDTVTIGEFTKGNLSEKQFSQQLDISTQDSAPRGLTFKPDGKELYLVGDTNDSIYQYTLTTAWDLSTASLTNTKDVSTEDTSPSCVFFDSSGTLMFMAGFTTDEIYKYTLSTAWDLSTASLTQQNNITAGIPLGIHFNSKGTILITVNNTGDLVEKYTLSTAWDLSTLLLVDTFETTNVDSSPNDITFSVDGNKMYIIGLSNNLLYEFLLTNSYDISAPTLTRSISTDETQLKGVYISNDNTNLFVVGDTGNIYKYTAPFIEATWGNISTATEDQSLDISSFESTIRGVTFDTTGSNLYITGSSSSNVAQFSLSSAWDLNTASFVNQIDISGQESTPSGISFNDDGDSMYVIGFTSDNVQQYALTTAWDVSTASLDSTFNSSGDVSIPLDITFNPDGIYMYLIDNTGDKIVQYLLSTPWDTSTATLVSTQELGIEGSPTGISFSSNGDRLYTTDSNTSSVYEYYLSSTWDITSLALIRSYVTSDSSPFSIYFNSEGTYMFIAGSSTDKIYRYRVQSDTSQILNIEGNYIYLNSHLTGTHQNAPLFIKNSQHDPEAYVKDIFKITELSILNTQFAEFRLTSWLQYFKLQLPKRKFYRNTCQWKYKGEECQYPGPGSLPIPGTLPQLTSNANPIDTSNEVAGSADDDDCSKSYQACKLRNNTIHFGGFPGTSRQVPRQ